MISRAWRDGCDIMVDAEKEWTDADGKFGARASRINMTKDFADNIATAEYSRRLTVLIFWVNSTKWIEWEFKNEGVEGEGVW